VIVPALHEGEVISELLEGLRSLGHELEIIVVDGGEGGDTLAAIRDIDVIRLTSRRGRGVQMNAGAAKAKGSVLIFLHADTALPSGSLEGIEQALSDGNVGGAFSVEFVGSRNPFFKLLGVGHTLRSRITRVPYGDQAIFFDANYFRWIGGFSEELVLEDVEIMTRVKRRRDRIRVLDLKVRTSSRRFVEHGILRLLLRYAFLRTLAALGKSPKPW
jgi:rSAM/selenodomain-associated transferase 2